jgi:hypothetical protein
MSFIVLTHGSGNNTGNHQVFGGGNASVGRSGDGGSGDFLAGVGFTPVDLLIKHVVRKLNVAPGAGKSVSFHTKKGNNVELIPTLTISDTAVDVASDPEVTAPAIDPTSNATIVATQNYINEWGTNAPAASESIYAFEYEYVAFPAMSFYHAGIDFGTCSFGASDSFAPFGFLNTNSAETTEDHVKVPFPLTGTFKRIVVAWKGLAASTTVEVCLRKNGVDTAFLFTLAATSPTSNWQATVDTTTTLAVTAGDKLDWRIKRTAGAGTSFNIIIGLGFS